MISKLRGYFEALRGGSSLRSRMVRGSIWLGAGTSVEHGARFARNMILTRLLAPDVLGLMAIILAVNGVFNLFTGLGIKEAVIQNRRAEEQTYLNGAWWLSVARSVLLSVIAYFSAPWVAAFYKDPQLIILLRFAFLSPLISGAFSPQAYVALKRIKYRQWVIISQGGGICGVLTTIILAFTLKGIWALMIGFVAESVARCLLSFVICPFKPGFNFDREDLKALFRYVRGMFGLPILYFVFMQADIFVVAKLCSKDALGLYSMAMALAQVPAMLMGFMDPLLVPAFSEMQNDNNRINRGLLQTTLIISFLGFPILLLVVFYGREILALVYGSQYSPAAIPFAILFVSTFIRICGMPIAAVYLAIGQPGLQRLFTGIRAILVLTLIYPAVQWRGLTGAATAGLISMVVSYVLQVMHIHQLTGLEIRRYRNIVLRSLGAGFPMVVVWVVTRHYSPANPMIKVFAGLIGCLFAYSFLLWAVLRSEKGSIWNRMQ